MDELKKAYEILGLSESASREELDREFDILIRKSRSRKPAEHTAENQPDEYELKLKAYRTIIDYEEKKKIEELSRERYSKWGRFAGTAEKSNDFFRIHKTKIIIGIISVIVVVFGITAIMNNLEEKRRIAALPPLDLSVMFLGTFMSDDSKGGDSALEDAFTATMPDWQRTEVELVYLPSQEGDVIGSQDIAFQQKAMALLSTERPDVYIVDESALDWLINSGLFMNLDEDASGELKPLLHEDSIVTGRSEEDTEDHIYGIRVKDSELAKQLPLYLPDMIVTIRFDSENKDKAVELIKRYLETTPASE
ncbi:molecular chaperone DnaJ [Paenibacillus brevis]|uniref:Molecular chaperone DnaJ n=1 Tax=Paenibacillus brevis TaxID=2841508 RepID=A0ABS6FPG6_9BACL|nr:molecular chaperone DnaJ [Paenibacillus brevis]MBU5672036.1 molecular chaperone DnaJ [Paenibacillus brevis]